MAPSTLGCKECEARYPLEASYVCERCFGPLEVVYDHSGLDAALAAQPGLWKARHRCSSRS